MLKKAVYEYLKGEFDWIISIKDQFEGYKELTEEVFRQEVHTDVTFEEYKEYRGYFPKNFFNDMSTHFCEIKVIIEKFIDTYENVLGEIEAEIEEDEKEERGYWKNESHKSYYMP